MEGVAEFIATEMAEAVLQDVELDALQLAGKSSHGSMPICA